VSLRPLVNGSTKLLLLSALLAGVSGVANGQNSTPVPSGARVRVKHTESGGKWVQGDVLTMGNDSLSLATAGASDTLTLATTSVNQMEVSRGRHSMAGKGLAIGGAIGAGLGLLLSAAAGAEDCSGIGCTEVGPGEVLAVTALLAAAGAGIGGLIGSASHSERWERVQLERTQARARPSLRGLGVQLVIRF